jgi:two-component system, cell cycle sensor histidine kinase and response regulator CckA
VGDGVVQSGSKEIAHAQRLKKALESGTAPFFLPPQGSRSSPGQGSSTALLWSQAGTKSDQAQRNHLEHLLQNTPEALAVEASDSGVLCVNRAFLEMFGYQAADVLGGTLQSLIVPPQRRAEARWLAECLQRGEKITLDTQRQSKSGALIDVALCCTPQVVEGKTTAVYTSYRDIARCKQAEALNSALYRVANISNTARDLQQFFAAVHSIVGELMYARNLYIAIYDPATELLSFPYFVDEHDSAPAARKLKRGLTEYVLRTGESLLATPEVLQKMGAQGHVERSGARSLDWMGVPMKVGEHTFGAVVVQTYSRHVRFTERDKEILTFVSQQVASAVEHKRNEQALRRSEWRYRSLVQSSVYGIYRASLEGKFLDVNPALIAMLGYESSEELLALDPQKDVFQFPEEHTRLIEEFRRSGRMDGIEAKWKRKNSTAITVRISGRAVSNADEPADVLEAIVEDVTERRILEDQFRQAQKMEAVGRLAGGVAHDFNNLLMVISGYTEVMLGQLEFDHPLHQKAQAIQQAADRATTLTRQLLAFSRKQMLELKIVDVNAVVQDIERLLQPLIGKNIEFITRLAESAGCTRADAGQLEQVLMNLVVNAKDAMPSGGQITIQTRHITLDDAHRGEENFILPGHYVLLSVSDNGVGMDRETQSRMFEPFFTTKEKGKGTGLGLSTVYGIIKQSGGYVMAHSEVGRGTTFNIYLPRAEERAEASPAAPASRTAVGGSETVLLVEDEDSVRLLVRETLAAKGYHVIEAENGQSGLAAAAAHSGTIDLIITDVVMPGMSGRELADQLVATRPAIKVLYLSGYTEDAIVSEGAIESGKAFLQKPFTLQNLSRKVREVLG